LTAAEASAFPAVQLFVERVSAIVEDFALTDTSARSVVEICRRLDGLPLAIEFAAPQVAALGIESLTARLDDTLPLLGARGRKKMPRHRTMRAVIDWSYSLLSEGERRFFRALGIFSGGLTTEAAAAVVGEAEKTGFNSIDSLADLVSKSLVSQMSAAPASGSGYSIRRALSRSTNSMRAASVRRLHAATPSTTAIFLNAPKVKSR
jgi:predicted ATPase